ncbi:MULTISPECIES: TlpA disulfide reductase family protein [unclassified Salinibacterium]|uniref:TlpA family protein disulfide reductase n=1 Tax=unclassified Salinibacterium TaxID=2632331 RepID=UPI001CD6948C|nr:MULTISPECIES: TlpA disulfide reductase family protein [unclassified Salinibacterium]
MRHRLLLPAAAVALATLLAGCSADPLAAQYADGTTENYISGDGTVTEIPEAQRTEAISFEGTTDAGEQVTSGDYADEVLVVNFWYAECPPCRVEAPDLQDVYEEFKPDGVEFLGVNLYNGAQGSLAFARTYGITYPSVIEAGSPTPMLLAFAGKVSPKAVPTTLVLDREGRIAARINGLVDPSVLSTLISDTVAEGS